MIIKHSSQSGVAAIIVILAMMIFGVLGMVLASLMGNDLDIATRTMESKQAFFVAESGVEVALWYLVNVNPDYRTTASPEISMGVGTFSVSIEDHPTIPNYVIITSTGYMPNATTVRASREVEMVIEMAGGISPIYDYTLYSDTNAGGELLFDENRYILETDSWEAGLEGNVHTNQSMRFRNGRGRVVNGTASVPSGERIRRQNWRGGRPYRTQDTSAEVVDAPVLDEDSKDVYRARAQAQGRYFSGNVDGSGTINLFYGAGTTSGIFFVEGDVSLGGTQPLVYTGIGTVVAGGDVTILDDVRAQAMVDSGLAVVSYGDITIEASGNARCDAAFYANGKFDVPDTVDLSIYGNVAAQQGIDIASSHPSSNVRIYLKTDVFRSESWNTQSLPASSCAPVCKTWTELN